MEKKNKAFVCIECFKQKECKESPISWLFLFIGLIATLAVRLVNIFLEVNPILAQASWYVGIGGFFVYFLYKFQYYRMLQAELRKKGITPKLLNKDRLQEEDYELLGTVLCRLQSNKDKINFFFIFLSSGLALLFGIYIDFLK